MRWNRTKMPVTAAVFLLLGWMVMAGEHRGAGADDSADDSADDTPTVVGVVRFDGPRPERKPIELKEKGGEPSECHQLHKEGLLSENLIVGEKGEVANVFVYVKGGLEKKSYPVPKEPAVLDQHKCMFRPRVQGVQVGQEFLMRNSDPLVHNVRSFSLRNRAFNIAQPAKTPDRKKVFTFQERAIKIKCDFHPWMKAFVFVMEHPYFSVTDEKGQFKIEGLPAGEYTLAAWHEEFGEQEAKITVGATGSPKVGFFFEDKAQ